MSVTNGNRQEWWPEIGEEVLLPWWGARAIVLRESQPGRYRIQIPRGGVTYAHITDLAPVSAIDRLAEIVSDE